MSDKTQSIQIIPFFNFLRRFSIDIIEIAKAMKTDWAKVEKAVRMKMGRIPNKLSYQVCNIGQYICFIYTLRPLFLSECLQAALMYQ